MELCVLSHFHSYAVYSHSRQLNLLFTNVTTALIFSLLKLNIKIITRFSLLVETSLCSSLYSLNFIFLYSFLILFWVGEEEVCVCVWENVWCVCIPAPDFVPSSENSLMAKCSSPPLSNFWEMAPESIGCTSPLSTPYQL